MSKRKLLLADDSITIQKVVNLTFADEGIEVIAVGDGDSAMQKINESLPDLILADVNMPGLSGYEICEQIKQNAETKEIPVILLVGSFEPFDEARAESIGANDYLTKPFQSIRQLVNKVTELLEARAKASETADAETDGDDSWQYADTREMPQEELQAANLGDAAMDDEMIDAEHFGAEPQAETEPQNAKTQELPASYIENIAETGSQEKVVYAPVDETAETFQPESEETEAPPEEVKETAFAIVSDEETEDEFQKELPVLDETEETQESPIYSESDHFPDEEEKPLYAETSETAESALHETPETSETVYEFADTERTLDTEEASEAPETAGETQTSESGDSPIYEISDEISEPDETDASEPEPDETPESETVEKPAEETEESPVSEVSEETSEEAEPSDADSTEETVSETAEEPAETETAETADTTEDRETETAETEQTAPVKEEVTESKASPIFDADDNLLELPPLVKPVSVAATAPQVSFVSEPGSQVEEETTQEAEQVAEPTTDTTETTAETVEPATHTEPTTESIIKEQIVEATGSTNITPEMIEAIAQKVAEKLSDRAIREIAWEVVPQMTELIIKKMAEENESKK
ncbi:MAG: response regulator [Pyrinomonadaceae bacterium]|nr:response regulator [Pyrinomonadaceae bacterium]